MSFTNILWLLMHSLQIGTNVSCNLHYFFRSVVILLLCVPAGMILELVRYMLHCINQIFEFQRILRLSLEELWSTQNGIHKKTSGWAHLMTSTVEGQKPNQEILSFPMAIPFKHMKTNLRLLPIFNIRDKYLYRMQLKSPFSQCRTHKWDLSWAYIEDDNNIGVADRNRKNIM